MEVEAAINRLEALVKKVDSDFNCALQRLANEFSEVLGDEHEDEINPVHLIERIEKAREEFKMLSNEAAKIAVEQKKKSDNLCFGITEPVKRLHHIQLEAGLEPSNVPSEELLLLSKGYDNADKENLFQNADDGDSYKGTSPASLRGGSKEFVPVTEEEFAGLSDLVRGRAKLKDVNQVYETLYGHFSKNPKGLLTLKELTKMGLKVTGATGGSKLKVLRTLKIIQINKQGNVKML